MEDKIISRLQVGSDSKMGGVLFQRKCYSRENVVLEDVGKSNKRAGPGNLLVSGRDMMTWRQPRSRK